MPEPKWKSSDIRDEPDGEIRIHATIRMLIPTGKRKEARSILGSLSQRIKLEEGCLGCRLYKDALEERALMFEQIWASENSFQKHLRSDEFHTVLLVVEMASEPPEIRFDRVSRSTGIGTIEQVRGQSGGYRSTNDPSPL